MRFAAVLYRILAGLSTEDLLSGNKFRCQVPVIRQIGRALQPGADGKFLRMVERRVVQYDGIKFIAFQKAADVSEERAAAHGGQIKRALEGQRLYLLIVQPPVGMAAKETIMPTASMGDIFPAILTLLGGTVGGYITFAGAHRLIDSGITGKENLKEINKSSVMGMGIATIVRIFLFLAVLGVVVATATSPAHTLDPANPTADAFLQGAGQIGYRFFGLVILCAAITSIVGCAYTSVSFLKTFSKTIEKNEKWFIVGFIAVSTICMALAGQPAVLLVLAGALNGLILPITLGVCLIASQKKSVMGEDYHHPVLLLVLGIVVVVVSGYLGITSLSSLSALFA